MTNHQKGCIERFVPVTTADKTVMRNRACPKCGGSVVGIIFDNYRPHKEEPYTEMGVSCISCDWVLQLRSSNP